MTIPKKPAMTARWLVAAAGTCWILSGSPAAASATEEAAEAEAGAVVPGAPQNLKVVSVDSTSVSLDWDAPTSGGAVATYEIYQSPNGNENWVFLASESAGTTAHTDRALAVGVTRHYRVRARNADGPGGWSNTVSATTTRATVPGAPRELTATPIGRAIRLNWLAPSSDGGSSVTGYQIDVSANAGATWSTITTTNAAAKEWTHWSLPAGVTRHYRVRARNIRGLGNAAIESATTAASRPGAPRNLRATPAGWSAIDLEWDEPSSDGGSAVTGYRVQTSATGSGGWSLLATTGDDVTAFRHTGLAEDTTVHYRVQARNSSGDGSWSGVVQATTELRLPGIPTGLTARERGTSRIDLDWNAPSSSGITGYRIEASPTGTGRWTVLETQWRSTAYTHTGLEPGSTRHYRVAAISSGGRGDWSRTANATTETTRPGAPSGLRVTPGGPGGSTQLILSWTRPSSDGGRTITGYRIEESANGSTGWTVLEANTGDAGTNYTDKGLDPGTTRYYRVAAINAEGRGDWSNVAGGTTRIAVPGSPRSLRAVADGPTGITLSWQPPSEDGGARVTGYRVEARRGNQSIWTTVRGNTGSTATTFRHTGLAPVTTWHYRVSAINRIGRGEASVEARATTPAARPDAPTGLVARPNGTSRIDLSWRAPRSDGGARITGYRIEESLDGGGTWRPLRANTGSTATAFSHTGLQPGTRRHYRVRAVNRAGVGSPSNTARATTEPVLPDAPRSLAARADGPSVIEVSWEAPASDGGAEITGYRIEASRRENTGWTVIAANTRSAVTSHRHTGLLAGSRWYYRVSAINAKGVGPVSRVVFATTDATAPGRPRMLQAEGESPSVIALTWEAPADDGGAAVTGYRIETASAAGGPWRALVANTRSTATAYAHSGLLPATTHFYRVSAINSAGVGDPAGPVNAATPPDVPAAPIGLRATARGTSRIDLAWTRPTYDGGAPITGYRIEESRDGGNTWRRLRTNTGSTATAFSHENLDPATTRHYRVSAINRAGVGRASNVARATTEATVPGVPRNLTARANGTSRIDLSWRAPSTDGGAAITGYRIEVSENRGATWRTLVARTSATAIAYAHTGLAPVSTRHYRVSAINRVGTSRASSVASATTDATVPDAPTGLTATANSPTQIDLAWVAPAYDGGAPVTGYRIEVSETGTAWRDLQPNTATAATSFAHSGLLPGSTRHYRVSAINRAGTGKASGTASASTDDPVQRAERLNTSVLPHVAAAMTSSTISAIAGRIDAVSSGMGMQRRMDMGGLSSMAATFASPRAGGSVPGRLGGSGTAWLFDGSSFQLPLGASGASATPQQTSGGGQMAVWGAGEYTHLGEPGAGVVEWSGSMVSAHVGADARIAADILAGVAASHNQGAFDFTDKTGAAPVKGTYGTAMTSVSPYVAWFPGLPGSAAWATAGFGWGDVEIKDAREALRTSPARTMSGAAGGSFQLLESTIGTVRVKAEGWAGRVMVDGSQRIDSVTLDMQRARLALEWKQGYRSANGNEVALLLEGGMRYDNGDGVNGAGMEVGGGLRYTHARIGLTAEGRGRFLVSGRSGYEEWGFGGTIRLDRTNRGRGLQLRLAPSYGEAASGLNELWDRGVSDAVHDREMGVGAHLDAEVAYGLSGFRGTPFGGFRLDATGTRAFTSGVRYDLGAGLGLRIEGTRREGAFGAAAHTVGVRGRVQLR